LQLKLYIYTIKECAGRDASCLPPADLITDMLVAGIIKKKIGHFQV